MRATTWHEPDAGPGTRPAPSPSSVSVSLRVSDRQCGRSVAGRYWLLRAWAAPVQRGEKFSQALAAMLRKAGPYWGETTPGLQVFHDARAEVRIGEAVEVKK